jgi:hypothetical protein
MRHQYRDLQPGRGWLSVGKLATELLTCYRRATIEESTERNGDLEVQIWFDLKVDNTRQDPTINQTCLFRSRTEWDILGKVPSVQIEVRLQLALLSH